MNVLYLCADRGIPIRGHKGASVHVRALSSALAALGHRVTIMTPRPGPADGPSPAAEIVEVPLPGGTGHEEAQTRAYADALLQAATGLVAHQRVDFIYERLSLWSDVGTRLARATGLPLVLEVNAPLAEEARQYRTLHDTCLALAVERAQLAAATAIAVVSDALAKYVIMAGARPERVRVVPNGIDPAHFHPAVRGGSVHAAYGLQGRTIVGFAGRPRPWHDIDTLLAAFAMLRATDPQMHLLLVGEMPAQLPGRLEELGLAAATTLTGPVPHEDVPRHIAAMDVAVSTHLPLEHFYFSPLKLFEYLACGVPVVTADIGQPAEIIRDGETGYLYPPGDAAALAAAIRRLLDDPAQARAVAWQGAAEVLSRYTWQHNAEAVIGWVEAATQPGGEHGTRAAGNTSRAGGEDGAWSNGTVDVPAAAPAPGNSPDLPLLDQRLRQRLYRATRPDLAGPYLAEVLPAFGRRGDQDFTGIEAIEVLKYKPGRRCVLAYTVAGRQRDSGQPVWQRVIGKVFRDERGQHLHAVQQRLWLDGFGPAAGDHIGVARSLGYVREMRMQVQAQAAGATLNQLVAESPITATMPGCAAALAKLHAAGASLAAAGRNGVTLGTYDLSREVAALETYARELAQRAPERAAEVARLHSRLEAWAATLPAAPEQVPVHRDFYYSQVLVDGPQLTLIDLDLLAWGDPAIDVGNFTAHLAFLGLDLLGNADALAGDRQLFLRAYDGFRPLDTGFRQRWAFYEAATWFRLVNVAAARPGLAHLVEPLYRLAAAA